DPDPHRNPGRPVRAVPRQGKGEKAQGRDHVVQVHRSCPGGPGRRHAGLAGAAITAVGSRLARRPDGWRVLGEPARTPAIMTLLVKICGLKTPDALDVALEAGADMVGFVFFPPSPRHVGYEAARALGGRVKGRAQKAALTVDASDEQLAAIIEALKPDVLQLHGQETPERVFVVRARFRLPVMKALPIAT